MSQGQQEHAPSDRTARLSALRKQLMDTTPEMAQGPHMAFSSGLPQLDTILPEGGFHRGQLVEWFAEGPGSGAGGLALRACWQAVPSTGRMVVLDRAGLFYPPAAAALGIELEKLILVRARSFQEEFWALDQALRARDVSAVWVVLESCDNRHFRRLQLSTEQGGTLGCLVRSSHWRHHPSWSHVQLLVQPMALPPPSQPGNVPSWRQAQRITLLRCPGTSQAGPLSATCHW